MTGTLTLYSSTMVVQGSVDANNIIWSGSTITTQSSIVASMPRSSTVTVRDSMYMTKSGHKYLTGVTLVNRGNLTVDPVHYNSYFYCYQYCQIINEASGSILTNTMNWFVDSLPLDVSKPHLVNHGMFVSASFYTQSMTVNWLVQNNNRMVFVYQSTSGMRNVIFNILPLRVGNMMSYFCHLFFSPSSSRTYNGGFLNGSIEAYAYPRLNNSASSLSALLRAQYQWQAFVNYTLLPLHGDRWDRSQVVYIDLSRISGFSGPLPVLNVHGYVIMRMYSCSNLRGRVRITGEGYPGLEVRDNSDTFLSLESSALSSLVVGQGSRVNVTSTSTIYNNLRLYSLGSVQLLKSPTSMPRSMTIPSVTIGSSASLNSSIANLTIYHLDLYGTLNGTVTALKVLGVFRWQAGTISSHNGTVSVQGSANITGKTAKSLDTATLSFSNPPSLSVTTPGVLVQLFQYRVPTDTSSFRPTSNLYYFPGYFSTSQALPYSFDNITTIPTIQFISSSLGRSSQDLGYTPVMYSQDGKTYQTTSPWTFTSNYAIRRLSYLNIATAGMYQFVIEYRYGSMRLWVDDRVVVNPNVNLGYRRRFSSPMLSLAAGFHSIRVDFVQSNSQLSTDSYYTVYYSGPGVSMQEIPQSQLVLNPFPSNNISSIASRSPPLTRMSDEGLMLSKGRATVVVSQMRQLEFYSDFTWLSVLSSTTQQTRLVNYGTLLKTGGGIASLTLQLNNQASGSITNQLGQFEFLKATPETGAYFWQNPLGGNWQDPNNWLPTGIPGKLSSVFIDISGTYQIIIPSSTNVQVANLQIGSAAATPELTVSLFSKLIVSDHLEVSANRIIVSGSVQAGRITWSGAYILSEMVSGFTGGDITVERDFLFALPPSGVPVNSRYFQNVKITIMGSFQCPYQLVKALYCSSCTVNNYGNMTIQSALNTQGSADAAQLNNYGSFTFEVLNSLNLYWNINNLGQLTAVGNTLSTSSRYMYNRGTWVNNGTVDFYLVTAYNFGQSNMRYPRSNGVWRVWGQPLLNSTQSTPSQYTAAGGSVAFLAQVYRAPITWDPSRVYTWQLQSFSGSTLYLGQVETYGRVEVRFMGSSFSKFYIQKGIKMPALGTLLLGSSSLSAQLIVPSTASNATIGGLQLSSGWRFECNVQSTVNFLGRVVLGGNTSISMSGNRNTVNFLNDLYTSRNSSLTFSNVTVTSLKVDSQGVINLLSTHMVARDTFLWNAGSLVGRRSNSSLTLTQGCSVQGRYLKSLDGLLFSINFSPFYGPSSGGVVVEYYQYRVPNPATGNPPSSPRLCTPCTSCSSSCVNPTFDNPLTKPNVVRLERDISQRSGPTYIGPVTYLPGGITANTSSSESFTYNYAVRRSSFLQIDVAGKYTFFGIVYYSYTRLWINGTYFGYISQQSTPNREVSYGSINLQPGLIPIRVEYLFASSSSLSNMALFRYEGPNIPRQIVPATKLFFRQAAGGGQWKYASPAYSPPTQSVCIVKDNSLNLIENAAEIYVSSSGVLDVQEDTLWYSQTSSSAPSFIINYGAIKKTAGTGAAVFIATLLNKGGSLSGNIQFGGTSISTITYWNNPNGGSWHDASNWLPARVPLPTDYVFITISGTYKVIVSSPTPVYVRDLELGTPESKPTLVVDYYTTINVTGNWTVHSEDVLINGAIHANNIAWTSGTGRMTGPAVNKQRGLVTFNTMTVSPPSTLSSRVRYLQNVTLICRKELTINESVTNVLCDGCDIQINAGATMTFSSPYFNYVRSTNLVAGSFKQGITNYGTIAFANPSSRYIYNDVRNFGTIHFTGRFASYVSQTVYHYTGTMFNYGTVNYYQTNVNFYNTIPEMISNGTWNFYGFPYNVPSSGLAGTNQWKQQLEHYYSFTHRSKIAGLPKIWDLSSNVRMRFYSSSRPFYLANVNVEGTQLELYASNKLFIQKSLMVDTGSKLSLLSGSNGELTFMSNSRASVGTFFASTGWKVLLSNGSTLQLHKQLYLASKSSLTAQSSQMLLLSQATIAGTLLLQNSVMLSNASFTSYGTVTLKQSIGTFNGPVSWQQGKINGTQDSVVEFRKGASIESKAPQEISGLQVRISGIPAPDSGVIAEYFQYRVATSLPGRSTPYISNPYLFPKAGGSTSSGYLPQVFNDPKSRATKVVVENQIGWASQYFGHAPVEYSSSGSVDSTNIFSFTFNFAVRYNTFLFVPAAGKYTFYFSSATSLPFQFWANNVKFSGPLSAPTWPANYSLDVNLLFGSNKIRLDIIQTSSQWSANGNMFLVSYEGPMTPLQMLRNNMFTRACYNGSSRYASEAFQVLPRSNESLCSNTATVPSICQSDYGASCLQQVRSGVLSFTNAAFVYVAPYGVLNFNADPTLSTGTGGSQMRLLVSGIVSKTGGRSNLQLNAIYNSTGCQRVTSSGNTIDLGTLSSK